MKAIQVKQFDDVYKHLKLVELDVPKPFKNEVLIQVEAGSLFPADELILQNNYVDERATPFIGGSLGIGRVTQSGGGWLGNRLLNKRVYFVPTIKRSGSWAEYAVADAKVCIVIGEGAQQNYINLGNSLTAVALVQQAIKLGHKSMVINAAAGSVGRLINIYASTQKIEVINIVRSQEQKALLEKQGALHVYSSIDSNFNEEIKKQLASKAVRYAVDSLSGEPLPNLLKLLPNHSYVQLIGSLSGHHSQVNVMKQVIAKGHVLNGFAIADWLENQSIFKVLSIIKKAKAFHKKHGSTLKVSRMVSFGDAVDQLPDLFRNRTNKLTILKP